MLELFDGARVVVWSADTFGWLKSPMFWYAAALRWSRNFTFLITFSLGGLWQMHYAPSGLYSMLIFKEFILISDFWEEMAYTNIYVSGKYPPFSSSYLKEHNCS